MVLEKLRAGDRQVPSSSMNAWLAQIEANAASSGALASALGLVDIQNKTGAILQPGHIVGLGDATFDPSIAENSFRSTVVIQGEIPLVATHVGMFAVMISGTKINGFGKALINGAVVCRLNMNNADDKYADIKDNDSTQLDSTPAGTARIQWVESGTGTKWAIVVLGDTTPRTIELTAAPSSGAVTVKAVDSAGDVQGGEVTLTVIP